MHRFFISTTLSALALGLFQTAAHAAVVIGSSVQNTAVNNALTGTASQTSTNYGGDASRAIDGNVDGNYGSNSTTHSDPGTGLQSWQVNLNADRTIDQVVLYNRDACCPARLSNFSVTVYDASNSVVGSPQLFPGTLAGGAQTVNFGGITGRSVVVQQLGLNAEGNDVLSLAEVTVLDYNGLYTNVAAGKMATQSSEGYGGSPARANDGDISAMWGMESVSHTADANTPGPIWWEVDLAGDYLINEIAIHNRADCCSDRLGNFRVSIYDNGSEVWGMDQAVGSVGSNINIGALLSVYEDSGGAISTGDKVRISLINDRNNTDPFFNNSTTLSLAEVQVFGVAVPEPGCAAMAALAGLSLLARRRK